MTVRQTIPYGDVTNYGASRLQGGTQTPTAAFAPATGFRAPGTVARTFPAQESAFPFRVWQGQLTDATDALLDFPHGLGTRRRHQHFPAVGAEPGRAEQHDPHEHGRPGARRLDERSGRSRWAPSIRRPRTSSA